MKKRNVIPFITFLIALFVVVGFHSLSWAQPPRKMERKSPRTGPIYKSKAATIQSVRIGTEADGKWYWKTLVKNTGGAELPKGSLTVQGVEILKNNQQVAASGSIVPKDLSPGETVIVKALWTRCCEAKNLRIDLWDVAISPHKKLASKTVSIPLISLEVKSISWDAQKKEWTTTVKNRTKMTMKIAIQGIATHSSPIHWFGIGGHTKVIPPLSVVTHKGHYSDYHPGEGDHLKVELRYFDSASWCGGAGWCAIHSKEIVLP